MLAQSGDRSGALEHYETYRERLARELEVEPLDDTIALVEAIRAGDIAAYRPLAERPSTVSEPEAAYADVAGTTARPEPDLPFLDKLKQRRIFHVGAAYLAVAWLAFQFTNTLADRGLLAEWVFPLVLALLTTGLPVTLLLAWASEAVPVRGTQDADTEGVLGRLRKLRVGPVLGVLAVLVVVLAGAILAVTRWLPLQRLEPSRVMVFPLTVTPEGNETTGERAASWIGYTLEQTGRFKWVDGWWELDEPQRAGLENVSPVSARETARAERAAFYIRGRISMTNDSVHVFAELHDVRRRTIVQRFNLASPVDETWIPRVSERVAWGLYSALAPDDPEIGHTAASDTPQAALEFLEGELAYRDARFSDALQHYQAAVALDSSFVLAALKGTMVAGWNHDAEVAGGFLDLIDQHAAALEPSRAQLARGLAAYWSGRADDAVEHLETAVQIDPSFVEAWAQLGETYTHFLPARRAIDSLARVSFVTVRQLEPEFRVVLYHLTEFAIRDGAADSASVYFDDFRQTEPDSSFIQSNELKLQCVQQTPQMIAWRAEVERSPAAVYSTGQSLAKAGAHTGCARHAWRALLSLSGDAYLNYRFGAVGNLQSLLVAEGRFDELDQLWPEEFADYSGDFYLLDANAGAPVQRQATMWADRIRSDLPLGSVSDYELWMLGVWEFNQGRTEWVRLIADSLAARADSTGGRLTRMLGDVMEARAVLAEGDSANALDLLSVLTPTKTPTDAWYPWETLAAEKMLLAGLLYATGDYTGAVGVASTLDAPARPAYDLIYLPNSLVIRARAARALGDAELEQRCRDRLTNLGRIDLVGALDRETGGYRVFRTTITKELRRMPRGKWTPRDRPKGSADPEAWDAMVTDIRDWEVKHWDWGRLVRRDILRLEGYIALLVSAGLISDEQVQEVKNNVDEYLAKEGDPRPVPDTPENEEAKGPEGDDPDDPPPPPWKKR